MRSAVVVSVILGVHNASGFLVSPSAFARARHGPKASRGCASTTMKLAQVPFSKYQGLGNDFILVDNREAEELMLTPEESAGLCDRWGVGCELFAVAWGLESQWQVFESVMMSTTCEFCMLRSMWCTTSPSTYEYSRTSVLVLIINSARWYVRVQVGF